MVVHGVTTRYRFQMSVLGSGEIRPGGGQALPTGSFWITLLHNAVGPTTRLTTGSEGCG